MKKNPLYSAVSFRYVMLEVYKKLMLEEEELVVILMIDHLIEMGNGLITSDLLALKMNYKPSEIDAVMVSLVKRGFLSYVSADKGLTTSLEPLREKAYSLFQTSVEKDELTSRSQERSETLARLTKLLEEALSRSLSPLEAQTVSEWLSSSYKEEEIKDAIIDAMRQNKKNVRAIDKILKGRRRDNDIQKEGASAVSETWNDDIDKTMDMAEKLWGKRGSGNGGK